jgi:hypothetical protein
MMIVMKYDGQNSAWKEAVLDPPPRDRSDAVRKLGKAGMEGRFVAFPEKYMDQVIEMERTKVTTEVVREKQEETQ